jgi:hypothetical protein
MLITNWCVQSNPVALQCLRDRRACHDAPELVLGPAPAAVEGVEVLEAAGEGLFFKEVRRGWQGEDREGGESRQGPQLLLPPL